LGIRLEEPDAVILHVRVCEGGGPGCPPGLHYSAGFGGMISFCPTRSTDFLRPGFASTMILQRDPSP